MRLMSCFQFLKIENKINNVLYIINKLFKYRMSSWNKPYPYHYTLDDNYPELDNVWSIATHNINKFVTVYSTAGCSGHSYVENSDGTINVESEMWFEIKNMSEKAMQICNYETANLVCVTMIVGTFENNETRIYKYDNIKKYKVNVRFYKNGDSRCNSYTHDDSPHQFGNPNIRVGEFTGLFGNLLNPNSLIDEDTIIESQTTPFTFWQILRLYAMSPMEDIGITFHIN